MRRHEAPRVCGLGIIALAALLSTSCSGNQLLTAMQLSLDSIAALTPALANAGVPPGTVKQLQDWSTAMATGVGQCAASVAQPGDYAEIVLGCLQNLTATAAPVLPAGTPQNIVSLVSSILKQTTNIIAALQTPPTHKGTTKAALVPRGGRWIPPSDMVTSLHSISQRASRVARGSN